MLFRKFFVAKTLVYTVAAWTALSIGPVARAAAPGQKLVAINEDGLTLGQLLNEIMADNGLWSLDSVTGKVVFNGPVILNPRRLKPSELHELKSLVDAGTWTNEGTTYDLGKSPLILNDRRSYFGNIIEAMFMKEEETPQPTSRRTAAPDSTPMQILENSIAQLSGNDYFIDNATSTIIITGALALPDFLNGDAAEKVWEILLSEEPWLSPVGVYFDFRKSPSVQFEKSRRQRKDLSENIRQHLATSPPEAYSDRLEPVDLMKPLSGCARVLNKNR